ncbi:hypothetical protein ACU4GD_04530 [Cupriavidus basilensis]
MKKGSEQTYEVLKKRIVAGHYTAGTQLKEEHIAEDMGRQSHASPGRA